MPNFWREAPLLLGGALLIFAIPQILAALPQSDRCDYLPTSIICPEDGPVVARSARGGPASDGSGT